MSDVNSGGVNPQDLHNLLRQEIRVERYESGNAGRNHRVYIFLIIRVIYDLIYDSGHK